MVREVTHDKDFVGIVMAENEWKMPASDKKSIREAAPKKEPKKDKEPVKTKVIKK